MGALITPFGEGSRVSDLGSRETTSAPAPRSTWSLKPAVSMSSSSRSDSSMSLRISRTSSSLSIGLRPELAHDHVDRGNRLRGLGPFSGRRDRARLHHEQLAALVQSPLD